MSNLQELILLSNVFCGLFGFFIGFGLHAVIFDKDTLVAKEWRETIIPANPRDNKGRFVSRTKLMAEKLKAEINEAS